MIRLYKTVSYFFVAVYFAAIAGCTPLIDNRGWRIDPQTSDIITPGVDNKETVLRAMGSSSSQADFVDGGREGSEWYYISQTTSNEPFNLEHSTAQAVIIINFDSTGTVVSVRRLSGDESANLAMNPKETQFYATHSTLWQQLFGNVGSYKRAGGK